jgi:diguanylate cyclase (GGDEF)-like protein
MQRYRASGALMALDVDRLKPINDTLGHAAGDTVLKAIVDVLRQHVRASDVLGRLGGDEFALLLWNVSGADANAKARALEAAVDGLAVNFDGGIVTTGVSAGVVEIDPRSSMSETLMRADHAMYARKAQRRAQPSPSTPAATAAAVSATTR